MKFPLANEEWFVQHPQYHPFVEGLFDIRKGHIPRPKPAKLCYRFVDLLPTIWPLPHKKLGGHHSSKALNVFVRQKPAHNKLHEAREELYIVHLIYARKQVLHHHCGEAQCEIFRQKPGCRTFHSAIFQCRIDQNYSSHRLLLGHRFGVVLCESLQRKPGYMKLCQARVECCIVQSHSSQKLLLDHHFEVMLYDYHLQMPEYILFPAGKAKECYIVRSHRGHTLSLAHSVAAARYVLCQPTALLLENGTDSKKKRVRLEPRRFGLWKWWRLEFAAFRFQRVCPSCRKWVVSTHWKNMLVKMGIFPK